MSYYVQSIVTRPDNKQIVSCLPHLYTTYETAYKVAKSNAKWLSDYSRSASDVRETDNQLFVVKDVGRDESTVTFSVTSD